MNIKNVKELKKLIKFLPDDTQIIIQKDSEGNGYSPLADVCIDSVYVPDSMWSGDVYDTNWSFEEASMDEDEWEELKSRPRVLVLSPIN